MLRCPVKLLISLWLHNENLTLGGTESSYGQSIDFGDINAENAAIWQFFIPGTLVKQTAASIFIIKKNICF